jgi:ligand-binding sensor domain-containing protein
MTSIYEDRSGALWIGTWGGGINRFDREEEQFIRFVHDSQNPSSLGDDQIRLIREDHTGTLWITTPGGLNRFDRKTQRFRHFVHDPKNPQSIGDNFVRSMIFDHTGTLWIGTVDGGLNKFDREKEQFTRFINDRKNPHSLSNNTVLAIHEDSPITAGRNILWIGTNGGLNKSDRKKQQFIHYTTKEGLLNSTIYGILEDDHGRLWLSNDGKSCFNPETETFRNYDASYDLQHIIGNTGAHHKSRSGEMFFSGIKGFTVFHPDSIKDNHYIPPVVITAFKRYNTDDAEEIAIVEKGISAKKEIQVSYKDNARQRLQQRWCLE